MLKLKFRKLYFSLLNQTTPSGGKNTYGVVLCGQIDQAVGQQAKTVPLPRSKWDWQLIRFKFMLKK